jgi:HK97 family phage major capsid protein
MESWKEKQERAAALIEVVKRDKASVQSAEDALKLRGMVDEARALMTEAGRERADLERARLDEILAEHDRQTTAVERERSAAESMRMRRTAVQPYQPEGAPVRATLSERMRSDQIRLLASPRYIAALPELETAALNEGTNASGGYLVVPAYMQDLFAETRRQGNALRSYGWMNIHPVETNQVLIPKGTGAATVAIVSENTAKPSADQQYTQIAVNIFTAAGISKQSKQLAMDSTPTVLDLSTRELGTLMGNLEEQKAYSGSGSGEPRGILNVTGLAIAPQTASDTVNGAVATSATAQAIIDQILNSIVAITSAYFAPPNGAMMHPRRLGFLLKAKDTATNYIFNVQGSFRAPNAEPALRSVTSMSSGIDTPPVSIFGLPIGTSANIPTNANYGTSGNSDQDVIIVGNWNELHWFQRQDVTLDTTDTAGTSWEQNQVWIRCEERWGSTAARYPTAFAVVHGKGLAATNV